MEILVSQHMDYSRTSYNMVIFQPHPICDICGSCFHSHPLGRYGSLIRCRTFRGSLMAWSVAVINRFTHTSSEVMFPSPSLPLIRAWSWSQCSYLKGWLSCGRSPSNHHTNANAPRTNYQNGPLARIVPASCRGARKSHLEWIAVNPNLVDSPYTRHCQLIVVATSACSCFRFHLNLSPERIWGTTNNNMLAGHNLHHDSIISTRATPVSNESSCFHLSLR